jgi:hypothetical protein
MIDISCLSSVSTKCVFSAAESETKKLQLAVSKKPKDIGCDKECSTPVYKYKLDSYGGLTLADTKLSAQNVNQQGTIYFKASVSQMA